MKLLSKILAGALLLLGLSIPALAQTTISGNLTDLMGNNVSNNTFVRFRLRNYGGNQPKVGTSSVLAKLQFDCSLTSMGCSLSSGGVLSGTINGNDIIVPAGTYYTVEVWNNGLAVSSADYLIQGGTWNFNSATPISSYPVTPPALVVLQNPSGSQNIVQPGGSSLSLNGLPLPPFTGSATIGHCVGIASLSPITLDDFGTCSSGAGNPSAPPAGLQLANATSTAFSTATNSANGLTLGTDSATSPTKVINPFDAQDCGPNPGNDLRCFGGRQVNAFSPAIVTISSGSLGTINASSLSQFINGDSAAIPQAGLTNTSTTPAAPTVTGACYAVAAKIDHVCGGTAGSTSAEYEISGVRPCQVYTSGGTGLSCYGVTAASPATSISNGQALGMSQTWTITSATRSTNTITYTGTTTPLFPVGARVHVTGETDPTFNVDGKVQSVGTNSFTMITGMSTANGASLTGGSGTVTYESENYVNWTYNTAFEFYCVYASYNSGSTWSVWQVDPDFAYFDDFGVTPPSFGICPATPPAAALNDWLFTTLSNVGSTSATINPPAANAVTSVAAYQDNTLPLYNLLNASQSIAPGVSAVAYIPATAPGYYFQTTGLPGDLLGTNNHEIRLNVAGSIKNASAPLTLPFDIDLQGIGAPKSDAQFALKPLVSLTCSGTVLCVRELFYDSSNISNITISNPFDDVDALMQDGESFGGALNGGLDFIYLNAGSGGGSNYTGIPLISAGPYRMRVTNLHLNQNISSGWLTTAPAIACGTPTLAGSAGNQQCGGMDIIGEFFNDANGILAFNSSGSGASLINVDGIHYQARQGPLVCTDTRSLAAQVNIKGAYDDTGNTEGICNLSNNFNQQLVLGGASSWVNGARTVVTGLPFSELVFNDLTSSGPRDFGQNFNSINESHCAQNIGACLSIGEPVLLKNGAYATVALTPVTGVSTNLAAGGSLTVSTNYSYIILANDYAGNQQGSSSPQIIVGTCTPTSGNQTCVTTWTALPGAASYSGYRCAGASCNPAAPGNYALISACTNITVLTCTDNGGAASGTPNIYNYAGISGMSSVGIWGQKVIGTTAIFNGQPWIDATAPPYNADPTGANDSSTAIVNALQAAAVSPGSEVYVPCGTYKWATAQTVTRVSGSVGPWQLIGANGPSYQQPCVFFNVNTNGSVALWFDPATAVTSGTVIKNIGFTDVGGSATAALQLSDIAGITLDGVTFNNFAGSIYTTGTVSVTNGSNSVAGSGTSWTSAMNNGLLWVNGYPEQIATVTSGTALTLINNYQGATNGTASYSIDYGGYGLSLGGGGNGPLQYGTVTNIYAKGTRYPIYSIGVASGGAIASRIFFYGGFINCNRVADSIGLYAADDSDTFDFNVPVNNCAYGVNIDNAQFHRIHAVFENDSPYTVVTTCNGGVAAESCTKGIHDNTSNTSNPPGGDMLFSNSFSGMGNAIEVGPNTRFEIVADNSFGHNNSNGFVLTSPGTGVTQATLLYIDAEKGIKSAVYTVSTLPSASSLPAGTQVIVSDATSFTPGTCTGSGSDYMIAVTNGTSWSCH